MTDQQQQQQQQSNHEFDNTEQEPMLKKRREAFAEEESVQALDANEEPAKTTDEARASISNIYYDCLERIFDFLDLQSLLNVAGTCKRLQVAAAAKFSDEYGTKSICIRADCQYPDQISIYNGNVYVYGLKFCLPFLRCFGAKILNLKFYCFIHNPTQSSDQRKHHVYQYISEYCADTLTDILFFNKYDIPMKSFTKPFKNVEKLEIFALHFANGLSNIGLIFPNLRQLKIKCCDYGEHNYLNSALHLPQLEHLIVSLKHADNRLVTFLEANHQLQSLDISIDESYNGLDGICDMIKGMESMTKLVIKKVKFDSNVNKYDLFRLASEHPLLVEVHSDRFELAADDVITFIGQLNGLKKFRFKMKDRTQYDRLLNQLGGDGEWQTEYQHDEDESGHIVTLKR